MANDGKKFTKGWRQAFYFPFGEKTSEKIYVPGNLDEEITLWLGEHMQRGRERAKSDFLFLSGLKELFESLFIKHDPFYTSANGVVMAVRDQRETNPPAKIIFPVFESRPQEYELQKWEIVEAIRVMEGLDKIRFGASADMIEPAQDTGAKPPQKANGADERQEAQADAGKEEDVNLKEPEAQSAVASGAEQTRTE